MPVWEQEQEEQSAPQAATLSSKFGSPGFRLRRASFVARARSVALISAGVSPGFSSSSKAAPPATRGAAMEVPLLTVEPVSESLEAETMLTPGAKIALQAPQLLPHLSFCSLWSVLLAHPTPIAEAMKV